MRTASLLLFALVLAVAPTARAATTSDLKAQQDALNRAAQLHDQQAQDQKSVADRATQKIKELQGQISDISSQMGGTDSAISDNATQLAAKKQQLADLNVQKAKVMSQRNALLVDMYESRVSNPDDLLLFSNDSFGKRAQVQVHIDALKKSVTVLIRKAEQTVAQVALAEDELTRKGQELSALKEQQSAQTSQLADFQDTQSQLQTDAVSAETALEAKSKREKIQVANIENQIEAALSAAVSTSSHGGSLSGGGPDVGQRVRRGQIVGNEGSTGFSTGAHVHFEVRLNNSPTNPHSYLNNGTLSWPLSSFQVTQEFGRTDFSYVYASGIHTGIDIAGPYGVPVYAPADGRVILHQWYGGYGHAWAEQLDSGLVVLLGHMI